MKISEVLTAAKIELGKKGVSNVGLDSLILLCHTLSFSKEQVIFNPDFELNLEQELGFFRLIKRRASREPVSHLIGNREFYGFDFLVNKNVLDPRPDSETLVELILEKFPEKSGKINFLEVGVGSGCIIISLLKKYQNALGLGLDISGPALEVTQKNSEKHSVQRRLKLLESNLFSVLDSSNQKFDAIISNPPYIPSADILELEPEVQKFEPILALDGGADGLNFYRRIAENAGGFLSENGRVFLEIGIGQRPEIEEIFAQQQFKLITAKKDLSQVERALEFSRK